MKNPQITQITQIVVQRARDGKNVAGYETTPKNRFPRSRRVGDGMNRTRYQ
jgi:hypothetical protein